MTLMPPCWCCGVACRLGEFGMKFMDDPTTVDPQVGKHALLHASTPSLPIVMLLPRR